MTPERFLFVLTTIAILAGAWLFNSHGQPLPPENAQELRRQNSELTREIDNLREQVANLRSMLADSPYPVPEPLIEFLQKDLGLDFAATPPVVKLVSPEELRNATERTLELIYGPDGLENEDLLWHRLGLLKATENLRANWLTLVVHGEAGFYDLAEDTIFLPEHSDLSNTVTQAVLVRFIAQQRIARLHPEKTWGSLDAYRAWHAAILGAAYDCEKRYLQRRSLSLEDDKNSPAAQRDALLLQFSPAFQEIANFPLFEGRERAHEKYLESRAAYADFLKNPPTTTRDLFIEKSAETPVPENFPERTQLTENALGALGLRLILNPAIGLEAANELAQHWQSDHYQMKDQVLSLNIVLDDITAAEKLAQELQKIYQNQLLRPIELAETSLKLTF